MRKRIYILIVILLATVQLMAQQFDFTALDSSSVTCTTGGYYAPYLYKGVVPGRHTVITEQGYDSIIPSLPLIPAGETRSVRLGNSNTGSEAEAIAYNIKVTEDNAVLVFKYAAVMQNPDHLPTRQPRLMLEIVNSWGLTLDYDCGYFDFVASSKLGWHGTDPMWKEWTTIGLDLSDYIGERIYIRLTNRDCAEKGHYGYAYFTLNFMPRTITSTRCGDAPTNLYVAPQGFEYRWTTVADTTKVLSSTHTLEVPMDHTEYLCRMNQVGKPQCNFSLRFVAEPRYPVAAFESSLTRGCADTLFLRNTSFVSNDGINPKPRHEAVDSAVWDLGDGRILPATDSILPVVYEHDGNYTVTLRAYLRSGNCVDIKQQAFNLVGLEKHIKLKKSICEGDYYDFNGRYLTEPGKYLDTLHQGECTEVYTLDLRVNRNYHFSEHVFICKGDKYNFRGQVLTEPGIYTDSLITTSGCDSVYEVILNLSPVYIIETEATICDVETYNFRGKRLNQEGVYYDRFVADKGCDSVYKLTLHVLPTLRVDTTYAEMCVGDTLHFGPYSYSTSGIYYDTIAIDSLHCGLRVLSLNVVHPTVMTSAQVYDVCADDELYQVVYDYEGPEPVSYSIYYDAKAKAQGFIDVIDRPYDGTIYDYLPRTADIGIYVRPDHYQVQIEFKNEICSEHTLCYTMPLLIRYPSWLLEQKWNDVVALLNDRKNGGYRFSSYSWSRNGRIVRNADRSYLYLPNEMQLGDVIEAYLTREGDDYAIPTCAIHIVDRKSQQKSEHPELVTFDVNHPLRVRAHEPGRYYIYTIIGQLLHSGTYTEGESTLNVPMFTRGLLFIRFQSDDGTTHTQSFLY